MPTYEYECTACGHRFDALQGMTEGALRKCPKCKKSKLRRLISGGSGVIFKGSGFYETDYKRNRPGAGGEKKTEEASSSKESGDSEKTESKPDSATKPETKSDAKKSDAPAKKDASSKKD